MLSELFKKSSQHYCIKDKNCFRSVNIDIEVIFIPILVVFLIITIYDLSIQEVLFLNFADRVFGLISN